MWRVNPQYRTWIASCGGSYSSRATWVFPAWLPKGEHDTEPSLPRLSKEERASKIKLMRGYKEAQLSRFEWTDLPFPAGADGIGWDGFEIKVVRIAEDTPNETQLDTWIREVANAGGDDSD